MVEPSSRALLLANVRRWVAIAALVAASVALAWRIAQFESTGWLALDFKLRAAQRLIDGKTLYPADGSGEYPYPPLLAMLVTPFLALPTIIAQYTAAVLCALAVMAAVWVVGVRDPLCFAAAAASGPVVSVAQIGNAGAFVTLLLALTWRFNSAPAAIAVALKLYAWPLLLWSAMRRGVHDLFAGACLTAAAILVPGAVIGFDGLGRYLSVAFEVTGGLEGATYALPTAASVLVTLAAFVAMWLRRGDSAGSLCFAVLAMLAASPVLWNFYFTSVFVVLGLTRPRFTPAWLVPFLSVAVGDYAWAYAGSMGLLLVWCGCGARFVEIIQARQSRPSWTAPARGNG